MILTDREIQKLIKTRLISIEPRPPLDAYDSTAVNLTLDPVIRVFRVTSGLIVDPGAPGYKAKDLIESATDPVSIGDQGWDLPCGKLVLGWTRERVDFSNIKSKVAARVEGKSGLARIGLGVHVTAPTIHALFPGTIQLELINHGPLSIKLRAGMAICQLIIETIKGTPSNAHKSQFAGQRAR